MVLADTEEKALEIGRRAYRRWWKSFMHLWHKHNTAPGNVNYPPELDGQIADGRAIATTPAKALDILARSLPSGEPTTWCAGSRSAIFHCWNRRARWSCSTPRHAGAARERCGRGGMMPTRLRPSRRGLLRARRCRDDGFHACLGSQPADTYPSQTDPLGGRLPGRRRRRHRFPDHGALVGGTARPACADREQARRQHQLSIQTVVGAPPDGHTLLFIAPPPR